MLTLWLIGQSARMEESNTSRTGEIFTSQEAMQIEQEAHRLDMQRKKEQEERNAERRRRMGLPQKGDRVLTREEQEARIWAFMYALSPVIERKSGTYKSFRNYKPTESDMEDDDEEGSDDDPANWFEDDQDDGRKGQNIVEPDFEDYSEIIRIDESRIPRNNFFDHDGD